MCGKVWQIGYKDMTQREPVSDDVSSVPCFENKASVSTCTLSHTSIDK